VRQGESETGDGKAHFPTFSLSHSPSVHAVCSVANGEVI